MHLKSLEGCRLAIGSYPPFEYNARGGGGEANLLSTEIDTIKRISFTPETFSIPPLTSQTTKFLSIPLPPGIKIEMLMDKLEGSIDLKNGDVVLKFESKFVFSISTLFQFPNLIIKTFLKTGQVKGVVHKAEGIVLQDDGKTTLVGVAMIPATRNKILDLFLSLPNEALAVLKCEIK